VSPCASCRPAFVCAPVPVPRLCVFPFLSPPLVFRIKLVRSRCFAFSSVAAASSRRGCQPTVPRQENHTAGNRRHRRLTMWQAFRASAAHFVRLLMQMSPLRGLRIRGLDSVDWHPRLDDVTVSRLGVAASFRGVPRETAVCDRAPSYSAIRERGTISRIHFAGVYWGHRGACIGDTVQACLGTQCRRVLGCIGDTILLPREGVTGDRGRYGGQRAVRGTQHFAAGELRHPSNSRTWGHAHAVRARGDTAFLATPCSARVRGEKTCEGTHRAQACMGTPHVRNSERKTQTGRKD
jgi:hypothetical protein